MSDNRTTELREKLNKLIIDLDRLYIMLDSPAYDMTLGEYEQEREKLLDGFIQAIAATVGSGMCEQVLTDCDDGLIPPFTAHCSACGAEWGFTPKYCHNCGAMVTGTRDDRKVVKQ